MAVLDTGVGIGMTSPSQWFGFNWTGHVLGRDFKPVESIEGIANSTGISMLKKPEVISGVKFRRVPNRNFGKT